MVKEKLRKIRIDKGMSQKQLAAALPTNVSNYCRKESGDVRITKQEWEKFAQVLEVSFDEIFEEDTPAISINYENSTIAENSGNFSTYHNIPESIIKNLKDFIKHLKEEN
ncbi:MAG: hypothetical protein ABS44_10830 [Chryseobacterium sp. SCN 40-13]|nr:MAG: hypothetical protein ABS44_10830 [Chryseobacterium sp. SCN 40-13]